MAMPELPNPRDVLSPEDHGAMSQRFRIHAEREIGGWASSASLREDLGSRCLLSHTDSALRPPGPFAARCRRQGGAGSEGLPMPIARRRQTLARGHPGGVGSLRPPVVPLSYLEGLTGCFGSMAS